MTVPVESKSAYTTLITKESYLPGVLVLAHTLRKHGSKFPLIAFYTNGLSGEAVRVLEQESDRLNLIPRRCEPLLLPQDVTSKQAAERFQDTWTKLRVFEVYDLDLDLVCYLDADMAVFNGNMDDIFAYGEKLGWDEVAANHVCVCNLDHDPWGDDDWIPENCAYTALKGPHGKTVSTFADSPTYKPTYGLFNSGMFLYRPSRRLCDDIMEVFHTSKKLGDYAFPDQDFLIDFFKGRFHGIGWEWNAIKTMRYWHPNVWRDDVVRCLHYIVDKPWASPMASRSSPAGYLGNDSETHWWWWNEYSDWSQSSAAVWPSKPAALSADANADKPEPLRRSDSVIDSGKPALEAAAPTRKAASPAVKAVA